MPHKETRKIIKVGNSLAVTIPKAWLRYFKLTNKDKVTVLSNGKVTIEPLRVINDAQSERSSILKQIVKWLASLENGATAGAIRTHTKWEITEGGATDNTIKKYIEDLHHGSLIEYKHPFWSVTKYGKQWLETHSL